MATLTAGISADQADIAVSGDVSAAVTKVGYRIDDEIVLLRAFGQTDPWSPRYGTDRARWVVARGAEGTTPATHLAGATIVAVEEAVTSSTTLVPPEPFAGEGGEGGGVTVDNTVDAPAEVTTLVATNATFGPAGTATLQPEVNIAHTTTGTDDAGIDLVATAEDGSAAIGLEAVSETSSATVKFDAFSGAASWAQIELNASDGLPSKLVVIADELHFNNGAPITRPVLPAGPTEQDIADALVALGLVTQAP